MRFGFGFRFLAAGRSCSATMPVSKCDRRRHHVPHVLQRGPPALPGRARADGRHGMKTGEGFYAWTPETIAAERARYDRLLRAGLDLIAPELPEIQP